MVEDLIARHVLVSGYEFFFAVHNTRCACQNFNIPLRFQVKELVSTFPLHRNMLGLVLQDCCLAALCGISQNHRNFNVLLHFLESFDLNIAVG